MKRKNDRKRKRYKKMLASAAAVVLAVCGIVYGLFFGLPDTGGQDPAVQTGGQTASQEINGNEPSFTEDEIARAKNSYISLGRLDRRGRCTAGTASLSGETMPRADQERGDIAEVHPTGWRSGVGWERCHLIGWQLSGLDADKRNLITGTHYFNVYGMLPWENQVAEYIQRTGRHVLYRVTPDFQGKEMVARGVTIEALSVEDKGRDLSFCVYVPNVAEEGEINYKTGEVTGAGEEGIYSKEARTYVINTNTGKFHYPSCSSVKSMSDKNKKTVKTTRSVLIEEGYEPCGNCEP